MVKKGLGMNICIPTLNSVNSFWKCIHSIHESSMVADIWVIDNGGHVNELASRMKVHKPPFNLGVAGSWNWFIDNVPAPRIITNDDIYFDTYAIETMWRQQDFENLIIPENLSNSFSCFLLSDETVSKVGRFDEWISPRYAYFEDNDYSYRMSQLGVGIKRAVGAYVEHIGSSTLKSFTKQQAKEHHDRFRLARDHYIQKWGGGPGEEKFLTPFNK